MRAMTRKVNSHAPSRAGISKSQRNGSCPSWPRAVHKRMETTGMVTTPRNGTAARFSALYAMSGWMGRKSRIARSPWRISIVSSQTTHEPVNRRTSRVQR